MYESIQYRHINKDPSSFVTFPNDYVEHARDISPSRARTEILCPKRREVEVAKNGDTLMNVGRTLL
jgi:hypothetical protein